MAGSAELRSPSGPEEWEAYHALRRRVLFENRGLSNQYDPNHPDERRPGHYPKVLLVNDRVIGVIRIDLAPPRAIFRRVAVDEAMQGLGHGSTMISLAEAFATAHGCREILSSVAPDAVGFYLKCGYLLSPGQSMPTAAVSMTKRLP